MITTADGCHALYLRELAHRTSNALQCAIAAVHLGRKGNPDHLDEAMDRLTAAAELQSLLAEQGTEPLDLAERLRLSAVATAQAMGAKSRVSLTFDTEPLIVATEDARRLSMIVSELVGNSIKHAFSEEAGSILVLVRDDGRNTGVMVEDDGVYGGWFRAGGQGRGIVDAIAEALGGAAKRSRTASGGSRVELVIPSVALVADNAVGSA